ncbi:MAG: hypothetical protein JF590_05105 [Gemmatimonadetes bacterium]|nr:hypothetical protein [Gemmatimonadota bacterium]
MRAALIAAFLLAARSGSLAAQAEPIDQGTLLIRIGDVEVGREQFTIQAARRGGLPGSTLRATASYPGYRPRVQYMTTLERNAVQTLTAFQFEVGGDAPERTVAELAQDRLTVRTAAPSRESAHEYPGGADLVVLDDSVYSLWLAVADLATETGASLRLIVPRTGWRGHLIATRARIPDGSSSISLTGDIEGRILLDENGRFSGLQLPARKVEILRQTE